MNDLVRPSRVAEVLKKFGLAPHKGLGQNFLVDAPALEKIVAAADIKDSELVVEIGPGLGTLTRELAKRARQVIAIEKDKKLTPVLAETLSDYANVQLVFQDALEIEWEDCLRTQAPPYKVVANLPYYVTTPLLLGLLESRVHFSRLVFLVQQEVAERMQAKADTPEYGALSLAVQYYALVKVKAVIPPRAFFPPPRVSSAVVELEVRECPAVYFGLKDERLLFKLIRAAFGQRRKTLANSLTAGGFPREQVLEALSICRIPPATRGEKLDLAAFVALAETIRSLREE
ncbi:MAG: 16S rRNA (adenine(1518)-N(6)/adenine(1519)-N(6))-dimethyltransferase RsmA [Selenomonadales bacterium]|nr:16S rRNA (adenine(1518)-N(6)/adenine(1519)-N(6))-dimethyltransferase RsmA [Selenomonadales bacterium]